LYRMHPFLVLLSELGKQHIRASLNGGSHCPRPAPIEDWLAGAFGHKAEYGKEVMKRLNPDLMQEAAIYLD